MPTFAPEMLAALGAFVRENPRYLNTTESRTISYRPHCNGAYLPSYPGKRVLACLRALGRGEPMPVTQRMA